MLKIATWAQLKSVKSSKYLIFEKSYLLSSILIWDTLTDWKSLGPDVLDPVQASGSNFMFFFCIYSCHHVNKRNLMLQPKTWIKNG